jgi:hypothetical protein
VTAPRQLVTLAVKKLFGEVSASIKVYNGFMPDSPSFPLGILHSIAGGGYFGPPLTDPHADVAYTYQLDIVGTRMDQVEKVRDDMVVAMLGRDSTGAFVNELDSIPGYAWVDRLADDDVPGGVDVERAPTGTMFTAQHRFTFVLTPE